MSGTLDYTHVPPPVHRCALPRIRTWDDTAEDVFATIREIPDGTRFTCDHCGVVYVVTWVPPVMSQTCWTSGYRTWQVETRRQRRTRLGLRWWQRGRA